MPFISTSAGVNFLAVVLPCFLFPFWKLFEVLATFSFFLSTLTLSPSFPKYWITVSAFKFTRSPVEDKNQTIRHLSIRHVAGGGGGGRAAPPFPPEFLEVKKQFTKRYHDSGGSENIIYKVNSRSFKLHLESPTNSLNCRRILLQSNYKDQLQV